MESVLYVSVHAGPCQASFPFRNPHSAPGWLTRPLTEQVRDHRVARTGVTVVALRSPSRHSGAGTGPNLDSVPIGLRADLPVDRRQRLPEVNGSESIEFHESKQGRSRLVDNLEPDLCCHRIVGRRDTAIFAIQQSGGCQSFDVLVHTLVVASKTFSESLH